MHCGTSSAEADGVAPLLHSWGLDAGTIQRFMDEDYTTASLLYLSNESIQRLLPKAGPRGHFEFKFNLWKQEQQKGEQQQSSPPPRSVPSSPLSVPVAAEKPSTSQTILSTTSQTILSTTSQTILSIDEDEPSVNELHKLLKTTPEGLAVIAYFNLRKKLNGQFRDMLCTRVIWGELRNDRDKRIDQKRFQELAALIVELFPTEDGKTWYDTETKNNRKTVTGKLHPRFYNSRRLFLEVGLISKSTLARELDSDEDLLSESEWNDDEDIAWLKEHDEPWATVLTKWKLSYDIRIRIFSRCSTVFGILTDFPPLQKEYGHELILEDFNSKYPELQYKTQTCWPKFLSYLRGLIQEKDRDFLDGITEESETVTAEVLCNLASIFKPRTHKTTVVDTSQKRTTRAGAKGKEKEKGKGKGKEKEKPTLVWRPSAAQVQESFVIRIEEIGMLKEVLKAREKVLLKYGFTFQPCVVLVGPTANIRQSLIVIDSVIWECPSPLDAVDSLFKVFFVLNCSYPVEGKHIWVFIQQCVYQMHTVNDYKDSVGLKAYLAAFIKGYESL